MQHIILKLIIGWIIACTISYLISFAVGKYFKPKFENGKYKKTCQLLSISPSLCKFNKSDLDWKVKVFGIVNIIHQIVIFPIHLIFMVIYIFPAVYTGVKFGWREYSDEVRWMYNTVKKYIIQNINYVKGIY